jgi:YD repeat-containing protein
VSITSNRNTDKAVFNSTKGRLDIEDAYRINNLEVYTGDQFIKGYKFNQLDIKSNVKYSNEPPKLQSPGNHYRLFLDSVEELDQSRNSINGKSYIFSYNTPEALPPRLSFAQDFLGFYNNKGNKSFLPNHKESMFWDVTTGNRNSDFRFVQKGILTKVTYPTKGYTQLEYQPIVEIITDNSSFVNIPIYFELDSSESPVVETNGPMILVRETFENDITMSVDHDTELVLNIDSGAEVGDKLFVNLIVENITTGEQEMYKSYLKDVKDIKHSIRFVKDNTYRFILESKFANHNYQKVFASLNFKYVIEEYQEADPNNKSGIRVKKIKNKASATAPEEVTTYFYNFKERIHEYSLKKFVIQDFISHEYREYICSIGGVPEIKPNNLATYTEHLLKDNSIDGLYTNFVSNYKNKVITISKGENFEAGGIEKEFRANGDVASRTVFFGKELTPMPSINFSLWDGTLMKETFFTKKNEVIKNTKETVNTYIVDESKTRKIQAYQANNRYINKKTVRGSSKGLSGIDIIYYPVFCKWLSLGSTTTIQYDTTGQEILSTTTNYSYETGLAGLPSSRTIINSRGHNEETRMYYPDDVTLTTSLGNEVLSPDEFQTIDRLKTGKSESRIGIPLQTVVNKNGAKTTQRTLYKTWFNSTQPEFVQTLKGAYNSSTNPMQNRIQYHKYDHKGNPLEVSKADGTHIMYIWGYQNQYPIAKIENASYTGIPTTATALINQLKVTSDNEDTVGEENTMRNLFKNLREHDYFKDAQITGYTYDPLIGVTSMTDPKGYTIYYEYDAFDRLQFIKDTEGNLVSERKYNYKNQ